MDTTIELTGNMDVDKEILKATFRGTGTLDLHFTDSAVMGIKMDYQSEDKVLLTIQGSNSLDVGNGNSLVLKGGLNYDLINEHLGGGGSITFTVPQKVASTLDIRYDGKGGASAKLDLKITF